MVVIDFSAVCPVCGGRMAVCNRFCSANCYKEAHGISWDKSVTEAPGGLD